MKAFFTIIVFQLLSIGLFGQVCLKGICLGAKGVDGKRTKETVGGIPGAIVTYTLRDGRIHSLGFVPSPDGSTVGRVSESELSRLITGLETNYGVVFEVLEGSSKSTYDEAYDGVFYVKRRAYYIRVSVIREPKYSPKITIGLMLMDVELQQMADQREQDKVNSDF